MVQFSRLRLPFMKTQTLLLIYAFVANCEGSFYRATARCRPTFAACRRAGLSMSQQSEQHAIDCTRAWIEHVVIRLRLCPYASKPFLQEQIRYTVSDAEDDGELLNDFFGEALLIQDTTQEELTTTMLVAPKYKGNGVEFYDLYVYLTDLLESEDEDILNNEIQPAFFHPDWEFDGLPPDAALHFEKRAPFPVINLLRRKQLDQVVKEGLERGIIVNKEISEHNEKRLYEEGYDALTAIFAQIMDNPRQVRSTLSVHD
mmetsp:Transcript_7511/g.14698  ORF Transcript_7511/g.14698 Transcript_7511/m.14698 type:complete len:258 (-) Transcript_7511:169-942(-)